MLVYSNISPLTVKISHIRTTYRSNLDLISQFVINTYILLYIIITYDDIMSLTLYSRLLHVALVKECVVRSTCDNSDFGENNNQVLYINKAIREHYI